MNKQQAKISAISITLIISALLIFLSINLRVNYTLIAICSIPFLIGFLPPFLSGAKHPMPKHETYNLSFKTLGFAILAFIIFAFKSVMLLDFFIIVLLASPIVWLCSYLAFKINDKRIFKVKDFFRVLPIIVSLAMNPAFYIM